MGQRVVCRKRATKDGVRTLLNAPNGEEQTRTNNSWPPGQCYVYSSWHLENHMIDHELGTMNLTQGAFQEGHVLIPHTDDAFTFSSSSLRCFLRLRRVSVGYVVARPQIVAAADSSHYGWSKQTFLIIGVCNLLGTQTDKCHWLWEVTDRREAARE